MMTSHVFALDLDMSQIQSFGQLIACRAQLTPERRALVFLQDGETETAALTYGELDQLARALAVRLMEGGFTGSHALLQFPDGLGFPIAFYACLYAGVVAVPAYPPRNNRSLGRLEAIINDSQAQLVISCKAVQEKLDKHLESYRGLDHLTWFSTDEIELQDAERYKAPTITASDLAFLQYTSGSTGEPKGVMVTHQNLMANCQLIRDKSMPPVGFHAGFWLPMFHDMGLVGGMLHTSYSGGTFAFIPPTAFLQQPFRWMKLMSDYKARITAAPNFAFDLCAHKISDEQKQQLDMTHLRFACNGAEPLHAQTIIDFNERFASANLSPEAIKPCFGMAETTLMATGTDVPGLIRILEVDIPQLEQGFVAPPEKPERSRSLVSCGLGHPDQVIAIVDPETCTRQPANKVGEIWISGPFVAKGYWNREELNRIQFEARLPDEPNTFLRTGDLGFIESGELFVCGRLKDLIIIGGRNFYPQDVERSAEKSHVALAMGACAAFSIEVEREERLVVLAEIKRTSLRNLNEEEVLEHLRQQLAREMEISPYALVLLPPGRVLKTSSGKIRRRPMRAAYLANELEAITSWTAPLLQDSLAPIDLPLSINRTAGEIEAWLRSHLGKLVGIAPAAIEPDASFVRYGLGSKHAVALSGALEQWLGRKIAPTIAFDFPTVSALAAELAGTQEHEPVTWSKGSATGVVALIGMDCRLPGAANLEAFWQLLMAGMDAITTLPEERWGKGGFHAAHTQFHGGWLSEVSHFDAAFFDISPREAACMDPQQRILLEVSYTALEQAGIPAQTLAGTRTGVFMGISNSDYAQINSGDTGAHMGTGNALSLAANRISYQWDLHGPSISVDTACSSSLVAVHQACRSLLAGECDMALAGGVNLILSPRVHQIFAQAGMMAQDGRCKTFDARADGYVRGEGAGVVVLKREEDATADGNRVFSQILGSAVNQDGRSNGLTAPNGSAQKAVIRAALAAADLDGAKVEFVECHGTGTSLGDPIEVGALAQIYGQQRPCFLSSVKTNIGHLESAAGIAGLIKASLVLHHGKIPASLHLKEANPHMDLGNSLLRFATKTEDWSSANKPRYAAVSSFGFGGTNAHLILAQATETQQPGRGNGGGKHLLTLSARDEQALRSRIATTRQLLARDTSQLGDLCASLNTQRDHHPIRLAVHGADAAALDLALAARQEQGSRTSEFSQVAFIFSGQGAQHHKMGEQLYRDEPVFKQYLDSCAAYLPETPLLQVLFGDDPEAIHQTAHTQPALFAFEYALAHTWMAWGVSPSALLGHSIGEYVAATLAGVFSLEDALKLVALRGKLMGELPRTGEMHSVFATEAQVAPIMESYLGKLSIAAINGPENLVISGHYTAMKQALAQLAKAGLETRQLTVSHAFHSPLMSPIEEAFGKALAAIEMKAPKLPLLTNLHGKLADANMASPDYWVRQMRETVRFAAGVESLREMGLNCFLEIGPKGGLMPLARAAYAKDDGLFLASCRSEGQSQNQMLDSLCALYERGVTVNWRRFESGLPFAKMELPGYPFQRRPYWQEVGPTALGDSGHPLLGQRLPGSAHSPGLHNWQAQLGGTELNWLRGHQLHGTAILPYTAYVEMALAAVKDALGVRATSLNELKLQRPLSYPEQGFLPLQLCLDTRAAGTAQFFVYAAQAEAESGWECVAKARITYTT